jgi:electron transfer flavoprotein alpha/beta subunit
VLTCELGAAEPPYPSLPMLIKSLTEPIAVLTPGDIGLGEPAVSLGGRVKAMGISPPRPRPKKVFTPDSGLSAAERMKQVISGGLVQRHSHHLEGSPREMAAALVSQLRKRKIV